MIIDFYGINEFLSKIVIYCVARRKKSHTRGIGWRFISFVVIGLNLVRWSRHLVIDCGLLGNRMY